MIANPGRACWCGASQLKVFSPQYWSCTHCGTLVSQVGLDAEGARVRNDDSDYYGKEYWLKHQSSEFGLPEIHGRARRDLPERCLHWLRTLLVYRPPPAKVLELGSAHGAFVALLRWAGYDAAGLEVSPWVVDYARRTFGVPVHLGPIEEQRIEPHSLDLIVLNDLLEHLPDPLATMQRCAELLSADGLLVIQTPCYPENLSYDGLLAKGHRFLEMMTGEVTVEHVYLYSRRSLQRLLETIGLPSVHYEQAIFAHYDMYCVASREPRPRVAENQVEASLTATPGGRLILAWLDKVREGETIEGILRGQVADLNTRLLASEEARIGLRQEIEQLQQAVHDDPRGQALLQLNDLLTATRADLAETQQQVAQMEAQLPFRVAQMARRVKRVPSKLMRLWQMHRQALQTPGGR
jgi:SAM-dependent methyltransferase